MENPIGENINCISGYNPIIYKKDETVATKYETNAKVFGGYKSEAELENSFIKKLVSNGYEFAEIHTSNELVDNLKKQIEKLNIKEEKGLNNKPFSDSEWKRFYEEKLTNPSFTVVDKTKMIQEEYIQELLRDDGHTVNIKIFDKEELSNNYLQVINQYEGNNISKGAKYDNRYDVTILVNGLPLVHIELKRRGVPLKEAYNQINRYQRDSFWADTGLFEFIQIFIISNGANTRYYANTLREKQVGVSKKKVKHSTFEQTSIWADGENTPINDLDNFTDTFLAPTTIRNILGKYCIFDTEKSLKVMRPYQIYAVEQIMFHINYLNNSNKWGIHKNNSDGTFERAGGYIWHATGSGKTLTSFKAATLLANTKDIDAVIFAVDRKDLSYQTYREFNKFKKDSVNNTKNTEILLRQLEECSKGTANKKIIVTTIQKLHNLVKKYKGLSIYGKKIVFIFDECHRSQFGQMHTDIVKTFKKFAIYGFTGTPIFEENAKKILGDIYTTERMFGRRLHQYITIDAINDGNILPWRFDMYRTFDEAILHDEYVEEIDTDAIICAPERIEKISNKILSDFKRLTHRGRENGDFCGMFAVDSIKEAKTVYIELQKQNKLRPNKLNIATIFTAFINEEDEEMKDDITVNTDGLDKNSLDFLNEIALKNYNDTFSTSYTTKNFDLYYQDLSRRIRGIDEDGNRLPLKECVDIVIVVDMLITGFDAPRLNVIWLDKSLKYHRLIQTISRVNRLCGPLKAFGNVCTFRDITKELNDAIDLFCNKDAMSLICLRTYTEYLNGYEEEINGTKTKIPGFKDLCETLRDKFPITTDGEFAAATVGNEKKKDFIKTFNQYLRSEQIISAFDEFENNKQELEENGTILLIEELETYRTHYQDIRDILIKGTSKEITNVLDDIVFEIGLIKQFDVDVDYIIKLIAEMSAKKHTISEIKVKALKIVGSSTKLRSKRELIEKFIEKMNGHSKNLSDEEKLEKEWNIFISKEFKEKISEIIDIFKLDSFKTNKLIKDTLQDETFDVTNKKIDDLCTKKRSFFDDSYDTDLQKIKKSIEELHDKFYGII